MPATLRFSKKASSLKSACFLVSYCRFSSKASSTFFSRIDHYIAPQHCLQRQADLPFSGRERAQGPRAIASESAQTPKPASFGGHR